MNIFYFIIYIINKIIYSRNIFKSKTILLHIYYLGQFLSFLVVRHVEDYNTSIYCSLVFEY